MTRCLIIGGTGQDGIFLSSSIVKFGMSVCVTSRDLSTINKLNYDLYHPNVEFVEINPLILTDLESLIANYRPSYIFNLTAQSSVGRSFDQPYETFQSCILPNLNILEAIRNTSDKIKYFHAASGDCFGDNKYEGNCILPPTKSLSPYASAKIAASEVVNQYKQQYNICSLNGYLHNHESVHRGSNFVLPKIFKAAIDISNGSREKLKLGNLDIIRDWGCAQEYMEGTLRYIISDFPENFILGTGCAMSLRSVVRHIFSNYNLNYQEFTEIDETLIRKAEIKKMVGTTDFLINRIAWKPSLVGVSLIDKLQIDFERKLKIH
jgi:GDPmannose 4,6-dehydratase